jgi:hypothetical protein
MLIIWLILVACSATAGLGPFRLSRGAVVALPFALAAFPLIFTVQEQIIATVSLGPLDLTISAEGLRRFLTIMAGSPRMAYKAGFHPHEVLGDDGRFRPGPARSGARMKP